MITIDDILHPGERTRRISRALGVGIEEVDRLIAVCELARELGVDLEIGDTAKTFEDRVEATARRRAGMDTPAAPEKIDAARHLAVTDPGPRYSVQRLAWVLSGCAGWHLRAIVWDMGWINRTKPTGAEITDKAAKTGKVRKVLSVYLADLERTLLARRARTAELLAVCKACARTRAQGATFDACADDEADAAADPDFDSFLCEVDDLQARAVLCDEAEVDFYAEHSDGDQPLPLKG